MLLLHSSFGTGKRLFKQWICSPLCSIESINDRLNAVEDIMFIPDVVSQVATILSRMPDLERLINKCDSFAINFLNTNIVIVS